MSVAIGCQTAYVAQVLRGAAQFSLEQGELINEFLGHTDDQGYYLLLLIQYQRAGITQLKERLRKQIQAAREERVLLKNRLGVQEFLSEADQAIYYSSWYYSAIHVLVSLSVIHTQEQIASRLGLSIKIVAEAIEFLTRCGLVEESESGEKSVRRVGRTQIHLSAESPFISKHHINWRLQAMLSIECRRPKDLHYSSVVSLSESDAAKIRERLIEEIKSLKAIVRDSKEECVRSLCLDFFEIPD